MQASDVFVSNWLLKVLILFNQFDLVVSWKPRPIDPRIQHSLAHTSNFY